MTGGRPLRFLGVVIGGWTITRAAMLWPGAPPPLTVAAAAQLEARPHSGGAIPVLVRLAPIMPVRDAREPMREPSAVPAAKPQRLVAAAKPFAVATPAEDANAPVDTEPNPTLILPPLAATPIAQTGSRLAGNAWLIGRGGTNAAIPGGELGGSQTGARLSYALGESRRFALTARVSAPLAESGKEAALGIDWQPTRRPIHFIVEQRFGLDGQRGGPTALIVGGINPTPIAAGFRLEGYAQFGAIARSGVETFGDGAARLTRPLATVGALKLDIGAGSWGAAQRGGRRLDIGPTLGVLIPVARKSARLTLDWRERVGGAARPGSGPAIAIGTDF